jgi:predicted ATPase/Tfp pilus assembly protein PilF
MLDTSSVTSPNNLPGQMHSLIGRQAEISLLKEMIRQPQNRLVTLTGTGGIGKTRLALELAGQLLEEFKDGVFVVTLSGFMEQPAIISAIRQTLRLKELAGQSSLEGLSHYLQTRQLLLILDNLEQAGPVASLVGGLLANSKGLKLLGTGRSGLNISGEKLFQVLPLSVPDQGQFTGLRELEKFESVILFTERARLVRPDFKVTFQNGPAIAKICRRLSGLPLALELAAARVKTLSPQALLARLDRGLELLRRGPVDWPAQQQTLRATIEWSYNLLSQPEQEFFAKLAVFEGSWSLAAAQTIFQEELTGPSAQAEAGLPAVASSPADGPELPTSNAASGPKSVNELLSSLVSQSLLYLISNPVGGSRYEMLEIIREYAQERLALTGLEDSIMERHATYYLTLVEQIAPRLSGPEQGYWYRQLELEYLNLRSALNWLIVRARPGMAVTNIISGLRLSLALWRFWHFRGLLKEGLGWLELMLSFSQKGLKQEVFSGSDKELITGLQHRLRAAIAVLALDRGNYTYARKLLEESLTWHRTRGNRLEIAGVLNTMGGMAANQGNYEQAVAWYLESLQIQQELKDRRGIAVALCSLAATRQASGDLEEAKQFYQQALPLLQEVGDRQALAQLLNNYGEILRFSGEFNEARHYFGRSLSINQEINDIHGISRSFISLGELLLQEGGYGQAGDLFRQALLKLNQIGDKRYIAVCLEAYATAAARQNDSRLAAQILGATAALREEIGAPLEPGDRPRYEALAGEIERKLGKSEFAAYRAEGYTAPLEDSLNLILHSEVLVN